MSFVVSRKLQRIRLQRRRANQPLVNGTTVRGSPPSSRSRSWSVLQIRAMDNIGEGILRHLRRRRIVRTKVARDPSIRLTSTRAEPGGSDTARRSLRLVTESDAIPDCMRDARASTPSGGEIVGIVCVKGRWTIVHLAGGQAAGPRMPRVCRVAPGERGSLVH